MAPPQRNGAEQIVSVLLENGIDVMFANPGTTEMQVVDALDKVPGMRAVLGLHENIVTGGADGYARMSRKAAATLLHLGVGLANGTANLHNARRAGSPVINLVGDMATWHRAADPLLASDIAGLASFASAHVTTPPTPDSVAQHTQDCVDATRRIRAGESRIATLILPHDCARDPARGDHTAASSTSAAAGTGAAAAATPFARSLEVDKALGDLRGEETAAQAVAALRTGAKTCFFVGGDGLLEGAIEIAGGICAKTGAVLMCENAFSRVDRGAGLPPVTRLAYFPSDAKKEFAKFDSIVFLGARVPVAMFGYEDGISQLVDDAKQQVVVFDTHDVAGALQVCTRRRKVPHHTRLPQHVASALDAPTAPVPSTAKLPKAPKGRLNASKLCSCIALAQPEVFSTQHHACTHTRTHTTD